MVGKTFTYLVGPNASAVFFNSKNSDLNAEEVYSKLVTPVFGKGVAYDVPNPIFLEQKKMLKTGLTLAYFRQYTPMVEKETQEYFERWGDEGEKGEEKASDMGVQYGLDISSEAMTFQIYPFIRTVKLLHVHTCNAYSTVGRSIANVYHYIYIYKYTTVVVYRGYRLTYHIVRTI